MAIVETYKLSKTYQSGIFRKTSVAALLDASIQVQSGEIFGLLGPNGAGKTTFVKLLLSIVLPTSGTAELLGKRIGDADSRARCGYLPENHRYPSFLTAFETLLFFGELSGLPRKTLKDKAHHLLGFVGLRDWSAQKTNKFSKGMLQRLGLAQALLNDPEVLFLDEPTDGIDPVGRKEMRDLFLQLKKNGVSIFLNSHLLSEVELISDRVAILNKGAVVKVGTLDEIRVGETFHEIQVSGTLSEQQARTVSSPRVSLSSANGHTTIIVSSDSDLNRTIDLLRSWGIMISSISQRKSSLEDSFLELVAEKRNP